MASNPVASTRQSILVQLSADLHASRYDRLDRRSAHVDERDICAVERVVVTGVDAQPLAADHVARRQRFGQCRITNGLPDFAAREFRCGSVGALVERIGNPTVSHGPGGLKPGFGFADGYRDSGQGRHLGAVKPGGGAMTGGPVVGGWASEAKRARRARGRGWANAAGRVGQPTSSRAGRTRTQARVRGVIPVGLGGLLPQRRATCRGHFGRRRSARPGR